MTEPGPSFPQAPRPTAEHVELAAQLLLAGRRGDTGPARRALAHPSARVRTAALSTLDAAGSLDHTALSHASTDPDPRVRRVVAELAAVHHGVALPALLGDDDPRVVEMTCWAAGERPGGPGAAVIDLVCAVASGHDDALCREAAVAALGAIGQPETLTVVLAALDDRATVRRRAVLALAAFDDPRVEVALERARTDRDWQVRQAAEDLLG